MTRQPLRRTFTLWLGGQNEAWVKVVDGKLIRHVENDGYAFMRHGPEADETEITLDDVMKEGRLSEAEIEALRAHLAGDSAEALRQCIEAMLDIDDKLRGRIATYKDSILRIEIELTRLKRQLAEPD